MELREMLEKITWLGHASFKINIPPLIFIDPWEIPLQKEKADIILVTHEHYDHCSPSDVSKLQKEDTVIITDKSSSRKLKGNVKTLKPGDKMEIKNVKIEAVPSYNIQSSRLNFHPKNQEYLGFIIDADGIRIYHPGDTDFIPEMKDIKVDILLIPCGGTYTMDANEAIEAAKAIKPKILIPMHYGKIVGSVKDAEKIKSALKDIIEVHILKP